MIAVIEGGLLIEGHADSPEAAIAEAVKWMTDRGAGAWAVAEAKPSMAPALAWFRDDVGFCQPHHDGAREVTMVHVNTAPYLPADP